jgi:hypothetical protein
MEKKDLDDLAYTTYLRAFARIASGATGGFSASDLTVSGEAKVTLALVLGMLDAKASPPTLGKRADVIARLEDNMK